MRDRRIVAAAGLAVAGSGLMLGWDWLTAVGVAPLIVSAALLWLLLIVVLVLAAAALIKYLRSYKTR